MRWRPPAGGLERLGETGAVEAAEAADDEERDFHLGKLHTCSFFFRHELPRTAQMATLLSSPKRKEDGKM